MEFFGRILLHLIQHHGKLEVPGLGSFSCEYAGAALQFATRTIIPPSIRIEFDARPTGGRDNHLLSYLVSGCGIGEAVARQGMEQFSRNAVSALSSSGRFDIPGLGTLVKDIEGQVIFKAEGDQSLLADAFGLGKLQAQTVYSRQRSDVPNREAPVIPLHPFDDEIAPALAETSEKKGGFRWLAAAAVGMAMLISAGSIYLLSRQNGGFSDDIARQEANIVPLSSPSFSTPVKEEKKAPVLPSSAAVAEMPAAKPVAAPAADGQYRFFVIAGSFQLQSKSNKFKKILKTKGFDAVVLPATESGQHRVSMGVFDAKEEALAFLNQNKDGIDDQLWIYKEAVQD